MGDKRNSDEYECSNSRDIGSVYGSVLIMSCLQAVW